MQYYTSKKFLWQIILAKIYDKIDPYICLPMHKTDQIMKMFDSQFQVYSNIIHASMLQF